MDFPTSDSLHLLEQGVMGRCISMWKKGTTIYKKKWTVIEKNRIDDLIRNSNKYLPTDIHRQVRSIEFTSYYKATEFRTILLYTGMIIFKNCLPKLIYEHFLRLCLGVRVCSCRTYIRRKKSLDLAQILFSRYCKDFVTFYGNDSVVSNIHNIGHILGDVETSGSLNDINTYPFENFLREVKLRVQASKAPLEQITRRVVELSFDLESKPLNMMNIELESKIWTPELKYENKMSANSSFEFIRVKPNVYFSSRKIGNSWLITKKSEIVQFKYAIKKKNTYFICGQELKNKTNFFTIPYTSGNSDIYLCNQDREGDKFYEVTEIKSKMICIPFEDQFVLIPLLHSIDEFNVKI